MDQLYHHDAIGESSPARHCVVLRRQELQNVIRLYSGKALTEELSLGQLALAAAGAGAVTVAALAVDDPDPDTDDPDTDDDPDADADAALHEDLHAILARPIFAHLTHATIVLTSRREMPKDSGNAERLVEAALALLGALFAPWRHTRGSGRDIATLVGGICGSGKYFGAVDTGAGEETRWLAGEMGKYAENPLLARLGL